MTAFNLEITRTARLDWSHDVAGNAIAIANFDVATGTLSIRSHTTAILTAPDWPVLPIAAAAMSYLLFYPAENGTGLGALFAPQYQDQARRLSNWVEQFVMRRPTDTLSLLKDVSNGITAQFTYEVREREGAQGPLETSDRGFGSCRDFAIRYTEVSRTVGFGACLVSGYLYNPSDDRLRSNGGGCACRGSVITPVRTGRPFAEYHATFNGLSGGGFLAGQKSASAKMAATRQNVCRRCERFLRQRKLQRKSGLSRRADLNPVRSEGPVSRRQRPLWTYPTKKARGGNLGPFPI